MEERVYATLKRTRRSLIGHYFIIFALIVLSVFLLWNIPWLMMVILILLFLYYSGLELLIAINYLRLTDDGVTMKKGLFNIQTNSIMYQNISDIQVNQDLIGQLLDYGTIRVNSAGTSDFEVQFLGVRNPQKMRNVIEEYKKNYHVKNRSIYKSTPPTKTQV